MHLAQDINCWEFPIMWVAGAVELAQWLVDVLPPKIWKEDPNGMWHNTSNQREIKRFCYPSLNTVDVQQVQAPFQFPTFKSAIISSHFQGHIHTRRQNSIQWQKKWQNSFTSRYCKIAQWQQAIHSRGQSSRTTSIYDVPILHTFCTCRTRTALMRLEPLTTGRHAERTMQQIDNDTSRGTRLNAPPYHGLTASCACQQCEAIQRHVGAAILFCVGIFAATMLHDC